MPNCRRPHTRRPGTGPVRARDRDRRRARRAVRIPGPRPVVRRPCGSLGRGRTESPPGRPRPVGSPDRATGRRPMPVAATARRRRDGRPAGRAAAGRDAAKARPRGAADRRARGAGPRARARGPRQAKQQAQATRHSTDPPRRRGVRTLRAPVRPAVRAARAGRRAAARAADSRHAATARSPKARRPRWGDAAVRRAAPLWARRTDERVAREASRARALRYAQHDSQTPTPWSEAGAETGTVRLCPPPQADYSAPPHP